MGDGRLWSIIVCLDNYLLCLRTALVLPLVNLKYSLTDRWCI